MMEELKIKIMIAEHDENDLELITDELKRSGLNFLIDAVTRETDFINSLKMFKPDIILSDFAFPYFDGRTAFSLREEFAPGIPFLFVSGMLGDESAAELLRRGVTDYVLKDQLHLLPEKLTSALKESGAGASQGEVIISS